LNLPSRSPIVGRDVMLAIGRLGFFFPGALAACALVAWRLRRDGLTQRGLSAWEATLAFSVPASIVANARIGGADNVWMLVVPVAAVVLGRYWAESVPHLSWRHVIFYPIALQAAVLPHRPMAERPTASDRQTYEALVARLRQLPGPVFNPLLPYESLLAGHEPSPPFVQLADYPSDGPLFRQLEANFRERHFAIVVSDIDHRIFPGFEQNYHELETWPLRGPAFDGVLQVFKPNATR